MLLQTIVVRTGEFDIVTCRDGEEAIAALERRHFDVVLLDLMMPRRSGFDVLDFLRAHRPEQLRVVLVLTALPADFAQRLDPTVVHALVAKPFDFERIVGLIRGIVAAGGTASANPAASDGVAPDLSHH